MVLRLVGGRALFSSDMRKRLHKLLLTEITEWGFGFCVNKIHEVQYLLYLVKLFEYL